MNTGHTRRLTELRRRTDRELLVLVRNEIECSRALARRSFRSQAETRYANARKLLALTPATSEERPQLEHMLDETRAMLDGRGAVACSSAYC